MPRHHPEALGPAQKPKMRDAAGAGEKKAGDQSRQIVEEQSEQPGAGRYADEEMADDEEQAAALAPLALRTEIRAQILNEPFVFGADIGHLPLLMEAGSRLKAVCRARDEA